jgi:hypothetical protein
VEKIFKQKSKTAIIAEMKKNAEIMYANSYDKERIIKTYTQAVKDTLQKINYNKKRHDFKG